MIATHVGEETVEEMSPLVSVVITTVNRPVEVERAVRSVLAQTLREIEAIVVIDGPTDTIDARRLRAMDPRIRVLALEENVGLAEARNCGIRSAKGEWVALLDDDDEWYPEKLRVQWEAAAGAGSEFVFAPCRFLEKTLEYERVMPYRLPVNAEKFSEYIYCDHGYLQPSMYFMSRALGLAVPFTKGLRHVEDSDWMLRMSHCPGVVIRPVEECLSVYYNYRAGTRESETTPWRFALDWGVRNAALFTRRAFPLFVARLCVNARRSGEPMSVWLYLMGTARRHGTLTLRAWMYFVAYWFLSPESLRRGRSAMMRRLQRFGAGVRRQPLAEV